MSRFISCLSHGLVIGARKQAAAPRAFAAIALNNASLLDSSANGYTFIIDASQYLLSTNVTPRRSLYTETALGIAKLDRLRAKKEQMFLGSGAKERYIDRLSAYVQANDVSSIYKDDLVNLIGIANDEKDLNLLEEILSKADQEQLDFFKGWGTSVMRLYYKMNQLDRAIKNVKDIDRFRDFFNLRTSYKVLMAMLYDAGRYDDVIDMYSFYQDHHTKESHGHGEDEHVHQDTRDLSNIAFAAMAKLNTEQALQQAEALYNKLKQSSNYVGLRPTAFVAYIATSNNKPKIALNLISAAPTRTYLSLRELKIICLIHMGRFEDILLQLREYVSSLKRESNLLLQGTYDKIMENKDQVQDPAMRQELEDILNEIKEGGHVSSIKIEELIFKPIENERLPIAQLRSNRMGVEFQRGGGYNNNRYQGGAGGGGGNYNNNNNNYNNNGYQQRGSPRGYQNQYGNNQYNQRDRQPRRNNYERDGEEQEFEGAEGRRTGGGGRQQSRFSYQNMIMD